MVKKIFFLLMVLIIFISGCASKEEKRDTYFQKGEVLFENKDFVKAKLEFKNVLQIDPRFAPAYYQLGLCEKNLKNWRKAFGFFSKAVELDPKLWEAQLSLAEIFMMARQLDKAREKITLVLETQPENLRALLVNSLVLIKEDKLDEAENILNNILENDPKKLDARLILASLLEKKFGHSEAEMVLKQGLAEDKKNSSLLLSLASLYAREKEFSQAESIYRQIVQYYPDKKEYLLIQAQFYLTAYQPGKARKIYESLIKKEPENSDYRAVMAKFYLGQKETGKAIEVLKKAVTDLPGELKLKLLLGEVNLKNNQVDQSLKIYQDLIDNHPADLETLTARLQVAKICFLQGKIDQSMDQLEIVLKENPRDIGAHSLRGTIFLSQGKGLEAVGEFRLIVQENPDDPKGYFNLARAHLLNKEKALTLDNLKKAININPRYQEALDLILNLYGREKSFDEAISLLKDILNKDPENLLAISRLGSFYLTKGDTDRAEENFLKLRQKAPTSPDGFIKMSLVMIKKKDYGAAESELEKALALQPENIKILSRVVNLHMFLKKPKRALQRCRDQIRKIPDAEPGIRLLMSRIYSAQTKFIEAEKEIKKVINLKPDTIAPYTELGNLYLREGKIDQGIEEFKFASKKSPNKVNLKFMIGNLYESKKDYAQARKWYEKVVDEHPKFIPGRNNLAYMYAARFPDQNNLEQALKLINEIPEKLLDANTLDTLGWVYYQRKEYGRAIKVFKTAAAKGSTPILELHLGLAYLKTNQTIFARDAIKKALKGEGKGLSDEDKKIAIKSLKMLEE